MLYDFEEIIYKGNFKWDFYIFCLGKNYRIILSGISNFFLGILFYFKKINFEKYINHYFFFLKYFENINELANEFFENKKDKINSRFLLELDKENTTVITSLPDVLVRPFLENFNIKQSFVSKWGLKENKITEFPTINLTVKYQKGFLSKNSEFLSVENVEEKFVKIRKKFVPFSLYKILKNIKEKALFLFLIISLALFITFINFAFSLPVTEWKNIISYFSQADVLLLNFLPIFLLLFLLYFVFGKIAASFFISSITITVLSFINKVKLGFREEPFWFNDIKLITESIEMTKRYSINISKNLIILFLFIIFVTIILFYLFKKRLNKCLRIIGSVVMIILIIFSYHAILINKQIYDKVGDKSQINIWSSKDQFVIRGFIYPFIYSTTESKLLKPDGYNQKQINERLEKLNNYNIEKNQKVNIIAIMLEAYNDFTKFNVNLDDIVYKPYLKIKNESYSGTMIANVFGGGTVNTERAFLTGYSDYPDYRLNTNSFVWYFRNQGYYAEGSHPIYGWFYNRNNVNEKLGYENFYSYYNRYQSIQDGFINDYQFFEDIKNNFDKNKSTPYFHMAVTYQNHGPYYTGIETDFEYLKKDDTFEPQTYNMLNNYFKGISNTNKALEKLIKDLKSEKEPVILIIFGDHNPYFGEGHIGYEALNIDLLSYTKEAYLNTYEIPYLFWANDAAKTATGKNFQGEGTTISPMFLMAELFNYLDWKGNKQMQILSELKSKVSVISSSYYLENDNYVTKLSNKNQKLYEQFKKYNYYFATNFNSEN